MRVVLVSLLLMSSASALSACDQLNKPMPVPPTGTSASSTGAPASAPADAGSGGDQPSPPPPGDQPRVTPQPGDVQL